MSEDRRGSPSWVRTFLSTSRGRIAVLSLLAIGASLGLGIGGVAGPWAQVPLMAITVVVGIPLVVEVARGIVHREIGADVLALLALVTGALLGEWLVAGIIALMLSGGEALEQAASMRASRMLQALADRSPRIAHRRQPAAAGCSPSATFDISMTAEIRADDVATGDELLVLPHEICPVDGTVIDGIGSMDESFLTGEPYLMPKSPGSTVLSGAINGSQALAVRCSRPLSEGRYAQIAQVLARAESERPPIRRLADRLGGLYTGIALVIAILGWVLSGDPERFLAVVVIATPCPLLIGVPVAVLGAISLSARRGIIVKDPAVFERISTARTMIFDKTGTLTYGRAQLTSVTLGEGHDRDELLAMVGSLEAYSRHPLAGAITEATASLPRHPVSRATEEPGQGLRGTVDGREVVVTGRRLLERSHPHLVDELPREAAGLECVVLVDDAYAGTLQFRDEPRAGVRSFLAHLRPRHGVGRIVLLSGDKRSEVDRLAERVGIEEAYASVSPEDKLQMVREATAAAPTVFLGDGINDAPAMTAATVGVAFGTGSDIAAEAAQAVVLDSSLERLDELLHIGHRLRRIALQTAIGGIVASGIGMVLAAFGLLPPILGAVTQEVIDVAAILNASRVALVRRPLGDWRLEGGDAQAAVESRVPSG